MKCDRNKRIKLQFIKDELWTSKFSILDCFPFRQDRYYRKFSNKNAKASLGLSLIECKEIGINIRLRNGMDFPDPWDDYISNLCYVAKSWKHNSKRRKQYFREKKEEA